MQVPEVDVLAMTPDMTAFLERYVLQYDSAHTRLYQLTTSVTDPAILGFHYNDNHTLTAAEAFDTRSGNCIGFANLLVALAREAGLQAHYQQVTMQPEWSSVEDTLVVARHINVVVRSPGQALVVDTSGLDFRPDDGRRSMPDNQALALYYNNLGAEALLRRDLYTAWAYIARATSVAPGLTDPWINLGVVYGRNRQLEEAADMYRRALDINPSETAALSNLYEVYLALEDEAAAQALEGKVERYRRRNPYYLLKLSEDALEESRYQDSIAHLQDATEQKPEEHLFHLALARSLYLAGDEKAAERSLQRARELAPEHLLADYDLPLAEVVENY